MENPRPPYIPEILDQFELVNYDLKIPSNPELSYSVEDKKNLQRAIEEESQRQLEKYLDMW